MMRGETNPPGQHSRERWARGVAHDILKPHPSRFVRRGFFAHVMLILSMLMPVWLMDLMFTRATKLNELKRSIQAEEAKKKQ